MRGLSELAHERRTPERSQDSRQDPRLTGANLAVAEAQHAEAPRPQPSITKRVVFRIVERAVRLDDQPVPKAYEIEHVRAHRDLPPELDVPELAVAQQLPEELLRRRS
jgi:hypothetical protein